MKRNPISIAAVIVLLVMAFGPAGLSPQASRLNAQPELVRLATQQPGQIVSVIVQKLGGGSAVAGTVARLGWQVTQDLAIINAISANLSAQAALELAGQPGVRWVSLDAPIKSSTCSQCVDTTKLLNTYISAIRADKVWNSSAYIQGQGIGVAVVDSGINPNGDLYTATGVNRQVANVRFNTDYNQNYTDGYGHGTHVASIIGGDGSESNGQYIGVAPMAKIINVKVSNDNGSATMSNVVAGLGWVLQNKAAYNIRVVNLSLTSSVSESYNTSPLDAAVEALWLNKIVVVVSAGNKGSGIIYPPANDPFVITVGATDDRGTSQISDDVVTAFSTYGKTESGFNKPDLVAPGTNIVARLVNNTMGLAGAHPGNKVLGDQYFRMSGTSMAAPMVSGAVALLLQDEPTLTPDQVKYRLMATANKSWTGYTAASAGAGYLDIFAAVNGTTTQSANTGINASKLLWTGTQPVTWGTVAWNSVAWNSDYWGN